MNFAESLIDLLHYLQSPSDTYKNCLFLFLFVFVVWYQQMLA